METDSISADVDRVVLRAERDLDSVERNQDTREGVGVSGYHGNDFLPDAADDMGPGNPCSLKCAGGHFITTMNWGNQETLRGHIL